MAPDGPAGKRRSGSFQILNGQASGKRECLPRPRTGPTGRAASKDPHRPIDGSPAGDFHQPLIIPASNGPGGFLPGAFMRRRMDFESYIPGKTSEHVLTRTGRYAYTGYDVMRYHKMIRNGRFFWSGTGAPGKPAFPPGPAVPALGPGPTDIPDDLPKAGQRGPPCCPFCFPQSAHPPLYQQHCNM